MKGKERESLTKRRAKKNIQYIVVYIRRVRVERGGGFGKETEIAKRERGRSFQEENT